MNVKCKSKLSPWYWRSQPLLDRSGSEVFAALFGDEPIGTLLESPSMGNSDLCRYSIAAGSPRQTAGQLHLWTPQLGSILPFLQQLGSNPTAPSNDYPQHLPFVGGWLGWLGYDLAWEIERLPRLKLDSLPFPVAYWYEPSSFAVLDHAQQILWLAASTPQDLDQLQHRLESASVDFHTLSIKAPAPVKFLTSQTEYEQAVKRAKKYIYAGDIFQTNLSLRFQTSTDAKGWSIYRRLQQINPSPFASYWRSPWGEVISCSPERLVKVSQQQIETRPIAGTRSRGATPQQDQDLAAELLANTKERAEHIMLVDLERNDLGKVSEPGSVRVNQLLTVERYSHVMHLVSNVVGQLKLDCHAAEAIAALFPGGTITGCPKVRCMEIIEELEPLRRNLFYGSCGYLDVRGGLDLNILIRTLLSTPNQVGYKNIIWGQIGAGIVADSDPTLEWQESLNKAQAQLAALNLI